MNKAQHGYTLIELVLVIAIIGIMATIAGSMGMRVLDNARYRAAENELKNIGKAIVGNPELFDQGQRIDFGYIGDNGALPPDVNALLVNPGLATWAGPYIGSGKDSLATVSDPWQASIVLQDSVLLSIGSGDTLVHQYIGAISLLFGNSISGIIHDADMETPGNIFADSIAVRLVYPDGAGGYASPTVTPNATGMFSLSSIPIGRHRLQIIYIPSSDTLTHWVSVLPGSAIEREFNLTADLW